MPSKDNPKAIGIPKIVKEFKFPTLQTSQKTPPVSKAPPVGNQPAATKGPANLIDLVEELSRSGVTLAGERSLLSAIATSPVWAMTFYVLVTRGLYQGIQFLREQNNPTDEKLMEIFSRYSFTIIEAREMVKYIRIKKRF